MYSNNSKKGRDAISNLFNAVLVARSMREDAQSRDDLDSEELWTNALLRDMLALENDHGINMTTTDIVREMLENVRERKARAARQIAREARES